MSNHSFPITALSLAALLPQAAYAETVFSDIFGSSTLSSTTPAAPTATSTAYQLASTKNVLSVTTLGAGQLHMAIPATTSGLTEVQALFASTPVALANPGDSITLRTTFTATQNILPGTGSSSSINFGLFNSGGVAPIAGSALANSGLSATTLSQYDSGGVSDWVGYAGRYIESTGSSRMFARLAQSAGSDTSSESQDLLFDNVGGGAFDDPTGVVIGSSSSFGAGIGLAAGGVYTATFSITRNADGFLALNQNLYSGTDITGTSLMNLIGTTTAASTPTTSFDGFSLGYRYSGTSAASALDINSIEISTAIAVVPEPSTAALLLAGGVLVGLRRRN